MAIQEEFEKLVDRLKTERDELKLKMDRLQAQNNQLCKQIIGQRKKPLNTKEEYQRVKKQLSDISEPCSPTGTKKVGEGTCDASTLFAIKTQLEKVYKRFLLELNKTYDGDVSLYSMKSPDVCAVEHDLNRIIVGLQEQIQARTEPTGTHLYTLRNSEQMKLGRRVLTFNQSGPQPNLQRKSALDFKQS